MGACNPNAVRPGLCESAVALAWGAPLEIADMFEVATLEDIEQIEELHGEWSELLRRSGNPSPFVEPEFLLPWIHHLDNTVRPRFLTVREAGRLVGIAPVFERSISRLGVNCAIRGFPVRGTTPPLDLMVDPARPGALEALVSHWQGERDWDMIWLHKISAESRTLEQIPVLARRRGYSVRLTERQETFAVSIAGSWEDYLLTLGQKMRNNLRRNWRNCGRWGQPRIVRFPAADLDLDGALDLCRKVIVKSWKRFERSAESEFIFFDALARSLHRRGWLSLCFLFIDEVPVAYLFALDFGRCRYPFHNAYDPDFQAVSPGQLVFEDFIREAHERSYQRVDFLGASDYLARWTAQRRGFRDLWIVNKFLDSKAKARIYFFVHARRSAAARRLVEAKKESVKSSARTRPS